MTHLKIEQNNGITEQVSPSVIKKLYEIVHSGNLDSSSNLMGSLNTTSTYLGYVDYLEELFTKNGIRLLVITANKLYISFADPAVESYWANSTYGDGVGIALTDAVLITLIPLNAFKNNTSVVSFDELGSFTNLVTLNDSCFLGCSNLTSINLNNILTIKSNAFNGCTSLTAINFNHNDVTFNGWDIFYNCTSLTTITGAENISAFSSETFRNCTSLQTLTLKETADVYGSVFKGCTGLLYISGIKLGKDFSGEMYNTFYDCTNLKCIDFDFSSTAYYDGTFCNCSSLLDLTTNDPTLINTGEQTYTFLGNTIRGAMFLGCSLLQNKSFVFPNLTTITQYSTFYRCGAKSFSAPLLTSLGTRTFQSSKFQTINIPRITLISEQTFMDCTSLLTVDISNCITINNEAFKGCTALTTVGDLSNVTSIGRRAFLNCSNLNITNLDLSNVTSFGSNAFEGCTALNPNLIEVTLDSSSNYPTEVFKNSGVKGIVLHRQTIPQSVDGRYDFVDGMYSALYIDLSDALYPTSTTFNNKIYFYPSLSSVNLNTIITPTNINYIPHGIFKNWTGLRYLIFLNPTPPELINSHHSLGSYLSNNPNLNIYVPDSVKADYLTDSNWSLIAGGGRTITDVLHGLSELPAGVWTTGKASQYLTPALLVTS